LVWTSLIEVTSQYRLPLAYRISRQWWRECKARDGYVSVFFVARVSFKKRYDVQRKSYAVVREQNS
jgi:hypothetical protein